MSSCGYRTRAAASRGVGHAVGAEYLSRREHVEPKLIETCELPPGIASVSVSVDRVTVPVEEPVPKEPKGPGRPVLLHEDTLRKYGHEVSPRTQAVLDEAERAAKGARPKIQRNYRMAYCTTVTMHDSNDNGDALHTIRYGRMPAAVESLEQLTHRDVHRMMQRLQQDVITIRRRAGPVPVVLLADGAPELWRLFEQHLNENKLGCTPVKHRRCVACARVHRCRCTAARESQESMARYVQALEVLAAQRTWRRGARAVRIAKLRSAKRPR